METAEKTFQVDQAAESQKSPQIAPAKNGKPISIEPDLDFIRVLSTQGAATLICARRPRFSRMRAGRSGTASSPTSRARS